MRRPIQLPWGRLLPGVNISPKLRPPSPQTVYITLRMAPPDALQAICERFGAFRLVWAPERRALMGGYWEADGFFSYRLKPRYPNRTCWVLERWLHGRHYGTPETWTESTITPDGYLGCGPYPAGGVYECVHLFDAQPLRPDTLEMVLRRVFASRVRSVGEIREGLLAESVGEEAELDREFEEQWDRSHGVRRGLSFNAGGILQYASSDIEAYKSRLAAAKHRVKRDEFKSGFQQGELNV